MSYPSVGHPDQMPPGDRTWASVQDTGGGTIGAHDVAVFVVTPENSGNVGYVIGFVDPGVQMDVVPKLNGGYVPDQVLSLQNPDTVARQLDIPTQHFGEGYQLTFRNPNASSADVTWAVLQVIGPTPDAMILPYLSQDVHVASLAHGATSSITRVKQAGIYDRITVSAVTTKAATLFGTWQQVIDTGSGQALATITDTLGTVAGAGSIEADVPIRTPGLAVSIRNDDGAASMDATVLTRLYRLR